MYGQGTYFRIAGLDFRCRFDVNWLDLEQGTVEKGCTCTVWWKALRIKNGNSLAVDCSCLKGWDTLNSVPQTESVSVSDTVSRNVKE